MLTTRFSFIVNKNGFYLELILNGVTQKGYSVAFISLLTVVPHSLRTQVYKYTFSYFYSISLFYSAFSNANKVQHEGRYTVIYFKFNTGVIHSLEPLSIK